MKRKITWLEQRLIEQGYVLEEKTYSGNHSQHTLFYVYTCYDSNYKIKVFINSKRDKIDHFTITNNAPHDLRLENINELERVYYNIKETLEFISCPQEETQCQE